MGAALLSVYPASFIGCLFGSVVGAVAPLDLLVQLELQLFVLLHQLVIVAALHIVLHKGEGGLSELLLGVLRQQGAALAAQTLHIDDHQAAVCLVYPSPSPRDRTRSRMPSSA